MRSCVVNVTSYTITLIGCVILGGLLVFILILNTIYDVKDWINKYDYMSMNFPSFMFHLELYM